MKDSETIKSKEIVKGLVNQVVKEKVSSGDMELINTHTRRQLGPDEVYTFSLVLCDNEIDRDFEAFSVQSLYALEKLFEGKPGLFDHNPKAVNQTARIYKCHVEKTPGKLTEYGKPYYRLVAKAYLPKGDKNADLILSLDSGIQKEVSVGCAVERLVCSVCGGELKACGHEKGKQYGNSVCYGIMENPTDAYEWSFVAIPAQRAAGVIKSAVKKQYDGNTAFSSKEVINIDRILKTLKNGEQVIFDGEQAKKLYSMIEELEEQARDGASYKNDLKEEVVRLGLLCQPDISKNLMQDVCQKMSISELKGFKEAFKKNTASLVPCMPQLNGSYEEEAKAELEYNI